MKKFLRNSLLILLFSLVISVVYYVIFSLFFDTDVEKEIRRENDLYASQLPVAEKYARMAINDLAYLRSRDENIYRCIFKVEAPKVDRLMESDILVDEDEPGGTLAASTWKKSSRAMAAASRIEDDWKAVYDIICDKSFSSPPLATPVRDMNCSNVGAATGMRMNPFYKVAVRHDGIDIIASEGTPVYAAAGGRVTKVAVSDGGYGNEVEISHSHGYVTRYAHLKSFCVNKGQKVKMGTLIGSVGNSGRSFSTHLHYEVLKDGTVMDPALFFLHSFTPDDYLKVLVMSTSSGQSLD